MSGVGVGALIGDPPPSESASSTDTAARTKTTTTTHDDTCRMPSAEHHHGRRRRRMCLHSVHMYVDWSLAVRVRVRACVYACGCVCAVKSVTLTCFAHQIRLRITQSWCVSCRKGLQRHSEQKHTHTRTYALLSHTCAFVPDIWCRCEWIMRIGFGKVFSRITRNT